MSGQVVSGSRPPRPVWHGTPDEWRRLSRAVVAAFGGCRCWPSLDPKTGQVRSVQLCGTHAFLAETDPAGRYLEWTGLAGPEGEFPHYRAGALRTSVARPDRLLFAYRLRERWIEQEHLASTATR